MDSTGRSFSFEYRRFSFTYFMGRAYFGLAERAGK